MSDSLMLERAQRFLSALRHCQVLGMRVHGVTPAGLSALMPLEVVSNFKNL